MKYLTLTILLTTFTSFGKEANQTINWIVDSMPRHGKYSTSQTAFEAFDRAINFDQSGLSVHPRVATPSFCSSATYLVFLQTVLTYSSRGKVSLDESEWAALDYFDQKDGEGVWGRWNSNGPGVAKLFKDLRIGRNFESFSKAKKGDFMKIFWSDKIGCHEHGHLVVYIAHDKENITFWSSNQPKGYGIKTVPRSKVKWAIFSRLDKIKNLRKLSSLSLKDPFLENMLIKDFSKEEVRKVCHIR